MVNVKCLNNISKEGLNLLTKDYKETDDINEANAILVRSAAMHEIDFSKNLLTIARAGAGVNNIPLDKCAEKGIVVFNTPGANANGVKELVIAGMLLASRDIVSGINWVKENKAEETIAKLAEKQKKQYAGSEISGKKLGVIGLGAIGVLVANAANHLGMEVYGYDPYLSVSNALELSRSINVVKSLDEIYEVSEFISIHVPSLKETKGMINALAIEKMNKPIILNFSRDTLINDDDMEKALKSGAVRRYITDFPNSKSAQMENAIVIPHLGASTSESEDNCAKMAVAQVMDYIENGNINNSVNYPSCDMGVCQTNGRVVICHENKPNMISHFSEVFGKQNINIYNMENRSKGDFAYSIFDIDKNINDDIKEALCNIKGSLKIRIIK